MIKIKKSELIEKVKKLEWMVFNEFKYQKGDIVLVKESHLPEQNKPATVIERQVSKCSPIGIDQDSGGYIKEYKLRLSCGCDSLYFYRETQLQKI